MNITNVKSATQEEVLNYLRATITGITFVHGKAGCGKTYLIKKLVSGMSGCQVLAPTNLAASLYNGARTLHSFFYGAFDDLDEGYQNPNNLSELKVAGLSLILKNIKLLVIDEISMVRSDLFEMMHQICQKALRNDKPFGGIPLVLVGDMFQLPPIVSDDAVLEYLKKEYGGIYFFNSHVIQNNLQSIKLFELTKSYRQANDPSFVSILDAFRQPMSPQKKVEIMDALNSRVTDRLPSEAVYVASSNEEVRQVNTNKLSELPGTSTTIDAEYTIQKRDGSGNVIIKHSQLPSNEDICEIIVPSAYDAQLTFKVGARVVLCKSSKYWGYVNGDFGVIENFNGDYFTIRLDNGNQIQCPNPRDRYKFQQMNEYRYEMVYDPVKHHIARKSPFIQKTKQFPLKLAYAFTIHKAQGQTYEKVIIDLNSHIFAPGQLYVALSRAKSLQGLFLTKPITYSDIITDDSVFNFLTRLRGYNGVRIPTTQELPKEYKSTSSLCYNFSFFVSMHEQSQTSKEFILHSLNCFDTLMQFEEYEKAFWELQKVVDLISSTYEVDDFSKMFNTIRQPNYSISGCKFALTAIYEIYTDVVNNPLKQYQSDNRTITVELSHQS